MKLIQADLAKMGKGDVDIYYLADFHIGDPNSDYKIIRSLLDKILDDDNAFCILGGDLMNCAIVGSVSDCYSEQLSPSQELEFCTKIFAPLAENSKILGLLQGNHENRIWKTAGIDATQLMATQLGLADKYSPESLALVIKTGHNPRGGAWVYSLYCSHGSAGGRKIGSKLNRLADFQQIIDADVYCVAHSHSPAVFKTSSLRISPQRGTVNAVDKLFVNTGSALQYGGYGERYNYQPASNAYPVIHLSGTKKEATATM